MADKSDDVARNRYDRPNRYASAAQPGQSASSPLSAAKVELTVNADAWRPRNVTAAATYQPTLGERPRGRRDAHRLMEDLRTASGVANAGTQLHQSLKVLEESHQDLEETQERRRLIPLRAEQTKFYLGTELVKAQTTLDEVLDEQQDKRVDRQRLRELATDDFEITRLQKRRELLEEQARIDDVTARRAYTPDIRRQQGEAELQRFRRDTLRNEADAEAERSRRDRERRPSPASMDDVPDDLRGPLATERTVALNRGWVERKVAEIRQRAQAEGRPLSRQELEQIDQYEDALEEGEASIRRRGASDLS